MKTIYNSIAFGLCLISSVAQGQWTDVLNNGINYEFNIENNRYNGANDADGESDPTIKTNVWLDSWGWIGESCYSWECTANCTNTANDWAWWAGGAPFDVEYSTWMQGYESDTDNNCEYNGTFDDYYWDGYGTLRDGQTQQKLIYPSSNFRPCQWIPYLGEGGSGWLYPNSPNFDQIMRMTWRYAAGDVSINPLDFGTISSSTKSDINSNRAVTVGSTVPLSYTNTGGGASADVWYSFTINETSEVTISTDHSETDFDTYLYLYAIDGSYVAENDQGGSNNTSIINRNLCAGTYLIQVEGWATYTGIYKVSVAASPAPIVILSEAVYNTSCANSSDGALYNTFGGGVDPLSFSFNGDESFDPNEFTDNLPVGDYTMTITDACGTQVTENYTIENGDNTPPIAECVSQPTDVYIEEGDTYFIDFDDVLESQWDNCDVQSTTLFPGSLDLTNIGQNAITVTVTDANGLTGECISYVYINEIVGVDELILEEEMKISPNPNNGSFNIDLSSINLKPNARIDIFDAVGRVVFSERAIQQLNHVELENAQNGIYMLRLVNGEHHASKRISILN